MGGVIRVACASCGDVELEIESARLMLGLHSDEPSNVLEFPCPACGQAQQTPVGERATRLLTRAGITVAARSGPAKDRISGEGARAQDPS